MTRPNPFSIVATILTLIAIILILLSQTGQVNNNTIVSNHITLISIDTTNFAQGLSSATGNNLSQFIGIYGNSNRDSLVTAGIGEGLRKQYSWGYYTYCATFDGLGSTPSYCTPNKIGFEFKPYTALYSDLPTQYQGAFNTTVPRGTELNDNYMGKFSHGAFYAVFLGSIFSGVTLSLNFIPNRFATLLATIFCFLAALLIAIGLTIYTIIYSHLVNRFNKEVIGIMNVGLGLRVGFGNSLYIMWSAAGFLFFATVPLAVSTCIGNRKSKFES